MTPEINRRLEALLVERDASMRVTLYSFEFRVRLEWAGHAVEGFSRALPGAIEAALVAAEAHS